MVRVHLGPPYKIIYLLFGALAQLGERLPCTQEVSGSIPLGSTKLLAYAITYRKKQIFVLCSLKTG